MHKRVEELTLEEAKAKVYQKFWEAGEIIDRLHKAGKIKRKQFRQGIATYAARGVELRWKDEQ